MNTKRFYREFSALVPVLPVKQLCLLVQTPVIQSRGARDHDDDDDVDDDDEAGTLLFSALRKSLLWLCNASAV